MRQRDRDEGRTDSDLFPRIFVWENVGGAFSSNNGNDFHAVLEEIARVAEPAISLPRYEGGAWTKSGAIIGGNWSVAWRTHDAQYWGVPQRRKRIAVVADFNGLLAPEILFERDSGGKPGPEIHPIQEGLSGDSSSGGTEGESGEDAGGSDRGVGETGGCYTFRNNFDGQVIEEKTICLDTCGGATDSQTSTNGGGITDDPSKENVAVYGFPLHFRVENTKCYPEVATTLVNGTNPGFHNGIVSAAFKYGNGAKARGIGYEEEVCPTLVAGGAIPGVISWRKYNG